MRNLIQMIVTLAIALMLIVILHVIAACLHTSTVELLPGIVCGIWASYVCDKINIEVKRHDA